MTEQQYATETLKYAIYDKVGAIQQDSYTQIRRALEQLRLVSTDDEGVTTVGMLCGIEVSSLIFDLQKSLKTTKTMTLAEYK